MKTERLFVTLLLAAVGVAIWRFAHHTGEIATDLLFGWAGFIVRVFPQVSVQWDAVGFFGFSILTLLAIGHFFFRWLYRESGSRQGLENESHRMDNQPGAPTRVWRIRWTLTALAIVILMFAAGISMVGATHHIAWLAGSREPLFSEDLPGSTSSTNLKFIGFGIHNHHDVYRSLPTHWRVKEGQARHSWGAHLLPHLNYAAPAIDFDKQWDAPSNSEIFQRLVPEFLNAEFRTPPYRDARGYGLSHYAANSRIFDRTEPTRRAQIAGSTSNILLIGEVNSQFMAWGNPANTRDPANGINTQDGFGGANPGGAQFAMLDGSVQFVSADIDPQALQSMCGPRSAAARSSPDQDREQPSAD